MYPFTTSGNPLALSLDSGFSSVCLCFSSLSLSMSLCSLALGPPHTCCHCLSRIHSLSLTLTLAYTHSRLHSPLSFSQGTADILQEPKHIKEKIVGVLSELTAREWPEQWPDLLPTLQKIASQGVRMRLLYFFFSLSPFLSFLPFSPSLSLSAHAYSHIVPYIVSLFLTATRSGVGNALLPSPSGGPSRQ